MMEMMYIQKLSKLVNVVPILQQKSLSKKFNYESVKIEAKKQLIENHIEWFDM